MSERPLGQEWAGRVAFITGAVTGIGLGVAQAFADAGMRLALSYRNEADRAQTAPASPRSPTRSWLTSERSTC